MYTAPSMASRKYKKRLNGVHVFPQELIVLIVEKKRPAFWNNWTLSVNIVFMTLQGRGCNHDQRSENKNFPEQAWKIWAGLSRKISQGGGSSRPLKTGDLDWGGDCWSQAMCLPGFLVTNNMNSPQNRFSRKGNLLAPRLKVRLDPGI